MFQYFVRVLLALETIAYVRNICRAQLCLQSRLEKRRIAANILSLAKKSNSDYNFVDNKPEQGSLFRSLLLILYLAETRRRKPQNHIEKIIWKTNGAYNIVS